MLEDTMRDLRNEPALPADEGTTEINIPVDAFIPDDYITDTNQKLLMYKRLSKIRGNQELENMKEEFLDRYGIIPAPLMHLFDIISLKCFLISMKIRKVEYTGKKLSVHITDHTPLDMGKLLSRTTDTHGNLKLLPDGKIVIRTEKKADELIHFIRNLLMDIITL
jgi:transcription-repair coupling factor (superfamily II helicase)